MEEAIGKGVIIATERGELERLPPLVPLLAQLPADTNAKKLLRRMEEAIDKEAMIAAERGELDRMLPMVQLLAQLPADTNAEKLLRRMEGAIEKATMIAAERGELWRVYQLMPLLVPLLAQLPTAKLYTILSAKDTLTRKNAVTIVAETGELNTLLPLLLDRLTPDQLFNIMSEKDSLNRNTVMIAAERGELRCLLPLLDRLTPDQLRTILNQPNNNGENIMAMLLNERDLLLTLRPILNKKKIQPSELLAFRREDKYKIELLDLEMEIYEKCVVLQDRSRGINEFQDKIRSCIYTTAKNEQHAQALSAIKYAESIFETYDVQSGTLSLYRAAHQGIHEYATKLLAHQEHVYIDSKPKFMIKEYEEKLKAAEENIKKHRKLSEDPEATSQKFEQSVINLIGIVEEIRKI